MISKWFALSTFSPNASYTTIATLMLHSSYSIFYIFPLCFFCGCSVCSFPSFCLIQCFSTLGICRLQLSEFLREHGRIGIWSPHILNSWDWKTLVETKLVVERGAQYPILCVISLLQTTFLPHRDFPCARKLMVKKIPGAESGVIKTVYSMYYLYTVVLLMIQKKKKGYTTLKEFSTVTAGDTVLIAAFALIPFFYVIHSLQYMWILTNLS